MKKFLFPIVCVVLCFLSACAANQSNIYNLDNKKIIDSGDYYCIYKEGTTDITYDILNLDGETVFSETTDRPLEINMICDTVVDIAKGMGTGITVHRYYDAERNLFSDEFSYVLADSDGLIAFIDVPNEQPFENRKVVVRDIFDKDLFYKEYQVNFSNVDTPVIQAEFSRDGDSLQLIYFFRRGAGTGFGSIEFNR